MQHYYYISAFLYFFAEDRQDTKHLLLMNKSLNIPMKWGIVKFFFIFVKLKERKEDRFALKKRAELLQCLFPKKTRIVVLFYDINV